MATQKGKDLLIKINTTGTVYETLAGLRATRIAFNAETVDTTSMDNADGWRELLAGAGVRSASLSGSGVFKDAASDARARTVFFDATIPNFQVIIPNFGTVTGAFQITSLEYAGSHSGEATYEMSMASAGPLSFAAL